VTWLGWTTGSPMHGVRWHCHLTRLTTEGAQREVAEASKGVGEGVSGVGQSALIQMGLSESKCLGRMCCVPTRWSMAHVCGSRRSGLEQRVAVVASKGVPVSSCSEDGAWSGSACCHDSGGQEQWAHVGVGHRQVLGQGRSDRWAGAVRELWVTGGPCCMQGLFIGGLA
jgi:hypothetical protein